MLPGPICVSLTPRRVEEIFSTDLDGADCVEARLDYLEDPEESTHTRWDSLKVPMIATCRGRDRGGMFDGSIDEELRILDRAAENGARFVDVDYRFARAFDGAEVIGSFHSFEETPRDLERLMETVCQSSVSVAKVATMVRSWGDNRRLLELLEKSWPKPVVVVGMGEMGQLTRIVGPLRGSALTYASSGRRSAPGQLSLEEVGKTYRLGKLTRATRLIGIIGQPVGHSRSPELHNRAFEALGIDYVYLKLPVEDLDDFLANADGIGIEGFSVTIPHKVEIVGRLSRLTAEAELTGAVNTVFRENGRWTGDNTDVHGIRRALAGVEIKGRKIVILGTGGAARAAVAAVEEAASITLLSRRHARGTLRWSREVRIDRLDRIADYDCDLLINATPVGMAPDEDRCPVAAPIAADVVFDMVYNPAETRLLGAAAEQGKRTISGTKMFLAQAARQFEIWTGRPAPEEVFGEGPQ